MTLTMPFSLSLICHRDLPGQFPQCPCTSTRCRAYGPNQDASVRSCWRHTSAHASYATSRRHVSACCRPCNLYWMHSPATRLSSGHCTRIHVIRHPARTCRRVHATAVKKIHQATAMQLHQRVASADVRPLHRRGGFVAPKLLPFGPSGCLVTQLPCTSGPNEGIRRAASAVNRTSAQGAGKVSASSGQRAGSGRAVGNGQWALAVIFLGNQAEGLVWSLASACGWSEMPAR